MKYVRNLLFVCSTVLLYSGCYTELATVEQTDRDYAYDTDTTYDESPTTITNHYYLDDDYRRSRLRASFHYYYPENTSWIGAYYNSYFNDPYWGMRQWSWSYDPWYGYYPAYYPSWHCLPYDPWHPYYPIVYYPVYYPSPAYVSTQPVSPPRIRTGGASRDGNTSDIRSRPITSMPTETQATSVRTGRVIDKEAVPVPQESRKRNNEVSWWDRNKTEQPKEARPVERPRNIRTQNPPEKANKGNGEAVPVERRREVRKPTYTPAQKPSTPNDEARSVERPRESRRQSYNPPAQQSTPSAPAPSRGGSNSGSSSSSGGRKRD